MRRALRLLVRVALGLVVLAAAGRGAFELGDRLWPFPLEKLEARAASPVLTDREGGVLVAAIAEDEQWRRPVPLEEISPWLIQALVSVEDRRFFDHWGVDVLAAFRATDAALSSFSISLTLVGVPLVTLSRRAESPLHGAQPMHAASPDRNHRGKPGHQAAC